MFQTEDGEWREDRFRELDALIAAERAREGARSQAREQLRERGGERARFRCSVDGCERTRAAHGFCQMHYQKWKRYGDPLRVVRPYGSERPHKRCAERGCLREAKVRGRCQKHYRKQWREQQLGKASSDATFASDW